LNVNVILLTLTILLTIIETSFFSNKWYDLLVDFYIKLQINHLKYNK
jgi:hypothetical protein